MNISIFDLSIYIKFFIGLCALVNPIGMIPIFTTITNNQSSLERKKTNLVANFSASLILLISLFFGSNILNIFGISINSFRIAGGILIISIAFSMISGQFIKKITTKKDKKEESKLDNISVVPLAMPLIAGPGAISSTIVWSSYYSSWINLFVCGVVIFLFSFVCWLCFEAAPCVVQILGKTGINIITRIMGLLLMSLGIEFISTGISSIFPGLLH
ncbi:YchE family NAAT transporter [Buchnera aphidicola (Sitobion miscanthi)]|uniref:YchE family NAAT transporter n=1 Tax=Buchnera aphidicola TaxID=9 RepID=UPI0020B7DF5E|nr:YchE family NAAT transporter [Buchnera aphidicola]MCU4136961.1 YchE family NAAT transporter [Buchnera aphidicola (Sitobion miscanthi)]